ncbi:Hypothetical predicted protein [Pelobates cultripes]|uniref:Uncharacterized protein n=1 Tax=Pelobates cultripes TaxID=61616 RepID=A0AAD1SUS3_PELCU|nr:Hypothetical predicted protein [Pelobates cultripes]
MVEKLFKSFGAEEVVAVENYTAKKHLPTRGRHRDILNILYKALQDVTFQMERGRNPKHERAERKKFLMDIIHNSIVYKKGEQDEQEIPDNRWFPKRVYDYFSKKKT